MTVSTAQKRTAPADDLRHDYLQVVEPDQHRHTITHDSLERFSRGFTKPVVFRQMLQLEPRIGTRAFLEVEPEQKLLWRERQGEGAVAFRNKEGKTDYNYVSGAEGTAKDFLDEIFVHQKDVYAHLGDISSGFADLHKFPWGKTIFEHVRQTVFSSGWFQVPGWELSGHIFLGNNTEEFAEPSSGAPGSDWHMFPTTNLFVLVAGRKKWMSYPPNPGDQFKHYEELVFPSGGREGPVEQREHDTVYLSAGDVLFNVPYEWHKVTNGKGWSLGAAFRVIDRPYVDSVLAGPANKANVKTRSLSEEYAHMATSLRMATRDPVRMQMCLNTIEMFLCAAGRIPFLK